MNKRNYPDNGLKQPVKEFKNMILETVKELFPKIVK